jgi:hypothetical protein
MDVVLGTGKTEGYVPCTAEPEGSGNDADAT